MYDASKAIRSTKRCAIEYSKTDPFCATIVPSSSHFEGADRVDQISHLTRVPGIGPAGVIKLAHHRGGGPIRNLEELIHRYAECKGLASTKYEQDNAFYVWLKEEKWITHSRHDITLAISTMVLKISMREIDLSSRRDVDR